MTLSQNSEDLFLNVGIDSIGFYAPRMFLNLHNLAIARGVDPDKYKYGLMSREIRIPDLDEDNISLGLKAAYNALIRGDINPKEIDAIFVGTETTTYAVKSISNIYRDMLGIHKNCITQDISNACAAGTLAIINAISMIQTGIIEKALVISVDIASYELESAGEPTQGAGSVAMIISRNPRVAAFGRDFGRVSANINDFFRPAGEKNAQVFGKYSVESYLKFQLEAYDDLLTRVGEFYTDFYVFHSPYAKLPLKFMRKLINERWMDKLEYLKHIKDKKISTLFKPINFDYANQKFLLSKKLQNTINKKYQEPEEAQFINLWISHEILYSLLPALEVPSLFGNMYSAAIWGEIMHLIEKVGKKDETIYFGSYGSGATCLSGILKIQPEYQSVLNNSLKIEDYFTDKNQISVEKYENLKRKFNQDVKPSNKKYKWGKIESLYNDREYGLNLKFCERGCNLSILPDLDYCPKGHPGNEQFYFPIVGTLTELKNYTQFDYSPLYKGYFLIEENLDGTFPQKGALMEMEMKRYDAKHSFSLTHNINKKKEKTKEQKKVKGLLNWIPVYRENSNSPYEVLIKEKAATPLSSWKSVKSTDLRF